MIKKKLSFIGASFTFFFKLIFNIFILYFMFSLKIRHRINIILIKQKNEEFSNEERNFFHFKSETHQLAFFLIIYLNENCYFGIYNSIFLIYFIIYLTKQKKEIKQYLKIENYKKNKNILMLVYLKLRYKNDILIINQMVEIDHIHIHLVLLEQRNKLHQYKMVDHNEG